MLIRRLFSFAVAAPARALAGLVLSMATAHAAPRDSIAPRAAVRKAWESEYAKLESAPKDEDKRRDEHYPKMLAETLDKHALVLAADDSPLAIVLRRTEALAKHLETLDGKDRSRFQGRVDSLRSQAKGARRGEDLKSLYFEACALRREVAFSNPLLDFDAVLFVAAGINQKAHEQLIITQFYGCVGKAGGGLYVVHRPFSDAPQVANLLKDARPREGRYTGKPLAGGAFLAPDLSYDGKQVVFSWTPAGGPAAPQAARDTKGRKKWSYDKGWDPDWAYHVFRVNADGTGLVQLTDGGHNDLDPCFDPSGRIVFVSERRGGQSRCGINTPAPTYTLHSMRGDGSDIVCLSRHETNEWHPSIDNQGMVVYTRWDYVDRAFYCAHHLWTCSPDGRNPRAPHGNYAYPWGRWADWSGPFSTSREDIHGVKCRPYAELHIRAVPGSHRYVATAAPHHGWAFGSLVLLDTRVPDDYLMSQVKRITPDAKFPESEGRAAAGEYATPWPLSEDFYLCNYRRDLWLVDRFGNRELILAKSEVHGELDNDFDLLDSVPLRAREKPPVIPWQTAEGDGAGQTRPRAAISIQNVYESDQPWPEGTKIKAIRVVQVYPPARSADYTGIGYDREQLGRMSLGVVPVEADGSAHFEAPVGKTILFQALDEKGLAVQTMRSATYVHPGEHLSCVGCHELPSKAGPPKSTPLAMLRAPSKLAGELPRVEPMSFHRHVKAILQAKCAACHAEKKQAPDMTYASLQPYAFYFMSDIAGPRKSQLGKLVGKGGTRSLSGKIGARAAKLSKCLDKSHYDVQLSKDELRTLTLWLDLSSPEYGVYPRDGGSREKAGELVWPLLDVDPADPTGVEEAAPKPVEQPVAEEKANQATVLFLPPERAVLPRDACAAEAPRPARRPNVIIILSDDQGYGDFSCHGNPVLKTPNLDRLHAQGVRLADFHVAPMCTPTRGQLLTGLDSLRNGATSVTAGRSFVRRGIPTMPELFAKAGYKTALFGKWHLGDNFPNLPQFRGFQDSVYHLGWGITSMADAWENEISLRRWPKEADAAIAAGVPAFQAVAGNLPPGTALPIAKLRLKVGEALDETKPVGPGDKAVVFRTRLKAGTRTTIQTWCCDSQGKILCGAYFAYVKRIS
jgi:hypothetical protein